MKPISYVFATILVTIFFSSCSSIYMPNVPNTPMLSQQGEFSGGLHVAYNGNLSLNGAYAASSHFGIIGSGSYINNHSRRKDFKQKLIEVGGGYFNTFGPDDNRIIEVYAGYGGGSTDRSFYSYDKNDVLTGIDLQEVTCKKTFIQVNYSSRLSDNLNLFGKKFPISYGTAIRISQVDMKTFLRNGIGQAREGNLFLEPVFFTRMKLNNQVQLQYTSSGNFGLNSRKFISAGNSLFTIGAVVNLGGKK
ncbi:hypothetical protein ACXZ1K_11130 [Pedobacter sp. PWIIR3]